MANLGSLSTNYFATPKEGFTTTLASTISSGAATVPLNSITGYTNGAIITLVVDPTDTSKKQAFTGVVDTAGVQVTSVVWTEGTNQTHTTGATVVDYVTATHMAAAVKGILITHDQSGLNRSGAAYPSPVFSGSATGTYTLAGTPTIGSATYTGAQSGWVTGLTVPNTVTALGNRSYSLVINSTDLTGTVSAGMRLRTTRTVAAPTQCTSLNGTTQYYNKATPAGMTFTDDFTVSAWVKLSSYNGAANSTIASRYNGTSGWSLYTNATGGVELVGWNAGAANFSRVVSYQSVPLNKWVHIAAQLDMSTFTATTTTSYVMLDGVDVPSSVSRGGTNPVALIQPVDDLRIGAGTAGTLPFPGKIAQVAIYSAKVTQATILASMHQTLAGTETSLISAYSFNNSINDLNANANNLTANGSAVATNADSPFGGQADGTISSTLDYAIIQKAAFSTNTTLTVQVPEGCTIPTSGGVVAVSYSTQKIPYLFPAQAGKWRINSLLRAGGGATTSNATYGSFISGGYALNVPVGEWVVGHRGCFLNNTTTTVYFNISSTALTGLTSTTGNNASPFTITTKSSAAAFYTTTATVSQPQSVTAQVSYVMYTLGAVTTAGIDSDATNEIFAENSYL